MNMTSLQKNILQGLVEGTHPIFNQLESFGKGIHRYYTPKEFDELIIQVQKKIQDTLNYPIRFWKFDLFDEAEALEAIIPVLILWYKSVHGKMYHQYTIKI